MILLPKIELLAVFRSELFLLCVVAFSWPSRRTPPTAVLEASLLYGFRLPGPCEALRESFRDFFDYERLERRESLDIPERLLVGLALKC